MNFRYIRDRDTLGEESLGKMSVAVENGVDTSKPRGVFSRAFAKRAQPFEEALKTLNHLNKEGEALALQDDLTTHPTLALMRRILADAQITAVNESMLLQ
ncbi:hypothetical protein X777_14640 [Ooceraea biroi]|uniref:Uncharacterized protein n=1 Tax=Ooceraea biroi TaxID=2015173 RepID=A0A026WZS4_OOCBI|nr:hypothetical protein X777_14640 [Ooceraea biroi]